MIDSKSSLGHNCLVLAATVGLVVGPCWTAAVYAAAPGGNTPAPATQQPPRANGSTTTMPSGTTVRPNTQTGVHHHRTVQVINAGSLSGTAGLTVPSNQIDIVQFSNSNSLSVLGNIANSGRIFAVSTNPATTSVNFSAANIINNQGAVISTRLPHWLLSNFSSPLVQNLSLSLNAARNVINSGVISSAGNLAINAGGVIQNVLPTPVGGPSPVMRAAGNLSLISGAGSITNSGLIAANNINLAAATANNLTINSVGGSLQALNAINVGTSNFSGKFNTNLTGGDWLSNSLNVFSGDGAAALNVGNLSGVVNINAGEAFVQAATDNLTLGRMQLTGDPTFYNTAGSLLITQPLNFPGQDLSLLATGNITTAAGVGPVVSNSLVIDAGANLAAAVPPQSPAGGDFGATTITVNTGSSALGGSINMSNVGSITIGTGGADIIAHRSGAAGGVINLSGVNIVSGSDVQLIAEAPAGNAITVGNVSSGGNALLYNAGINQSAAASVNNGAWTGATLSPTFGAQAGNITAGALSGNIVALMSPGGNITTTGNITAVSGIQFQGLNLNTCCLTVLQNAGSITAVITNAGTIQGIKGQNLVLNLGANVAVTGTCPSVSLPANPLQPTDQSTSDAPIIITTQTAKVLGLTLANNPQPLDFSYLFGKSLSDITGIMGNSWGDAVSDMSAVTAYEFGLSQQFAALLDTTNFQDYGNPERDAYLQAVAAQEAAAQAYSQQQADALNAEQQSISEQQDLMNQAWAAAYTPSYMDYNQYYSQPIGGPGTNWNALSHQQQQMGYQQQQAWAQQQYSVSPQQYQQNAAAYQKQAIAMNQQAIALNNQLAHMPTQTQYVGNGFSVRVPYGTNLSTQVNQLPQGSGISYSLNTPPSIAGIRSQFSQLQSAMQGLGNSYLKSNGFSQGQIANSQAVITANAADGAAPSVIRDGLQMPIFVTSSGTYQINQASGQSGTWLRPSRTAVDPSTGKQITQAGFVLKTTDSSGKVVEKQVWQNVSDKSQLQIDQGVVAAEFGHASAVPAGSINIQTTRTGSGSTSSMGVESQASSEASGQAGSQASSQAGSQGSTQSGSQAVSFAGTRSGLHNEPDTASPSDTKSDGKATSSADGKSTPLTEAKTPDPSPHLTEIKDEKGKVVVPEGKLVADPETGLLTDTRTWTAYTAGGQKIVGEDGSPMQIQQAKQLLAQQIAATQGSTTAPTDIITDSNGHAVAPKYLSTDTATGIVFDNRNGTAYTSNGDIIKDSNGKVVPVGKLAVDPQNGFFVDTRNWNAYTSGGKAVKGDDGAPLQIQQANHVLEQQGSATQGSPMAPSVVITDSQGHAVPSQFLSTDPTTGLVVDTRSGTAYTSGGHIVRDADGQPVTVRNLQVNSDTGTMADVSHASQFSYSTSTGQKVVTDTGAQVHASEIHSDSDGGLTNTFGQALSLRNVPEKPATPETPTPAVAVATNSTGTSDRVNASNYVKYFGDPTKASASVAGASTSGPGTDGAGSPGSGSQGTPSNPEGIGLPILGTAGGTVTVPTARTSDAEADGMSSAFQLRAEQDKFAGGALQPTGGAMGNGMDTPTSYKSPQTTFTYQQGATSTGGSTNTTPALGNGGGSGGGTLVSNDRQLPVGSSSLETRRITLPTFGANTGGYGPQSGSTSKGGSLGLNTAQAAAIAAAMAGPSSLMLTGNTAANLLQKPTNPLAQASSLVSPFIAPVVKSIQLGAKAGVYVLREVLTGPEAQALDNWSRTSLRPDLDHISTVPDSQQKGIQQHQVLGISFVDNIVTPKNSPLGILYRANSLALAVVKSLGASDKLGESAAEAGPKGAAAKDTSTLVKPDDLNVLSIKKPDFMPSGAPASGLINNGISKLTEIPGSLIKDRAMETIKQTYEILDAGNKAAVRAPNPVAAYPEAWKAMREKQSELQASAETKYQQSLGEQSRGYAQFNSALVHGAREVAQAANIALNNPDKVQSALATGIRNAQQNFVRGFVGNMIPIAPQTKSIPGWQAPQYSNTGPAIRNATSSLNGGTEIFASLTGYTPKGPVSITKLALPRYMPALKAPHLVASNWRGDTSDVAFVPTTVKPEPHDFPLRAVEGLITAQTNKLVITDNGLLACKKGSSMLVYNSKEFTAVFDLDSVGKSDVVFVSNKDKIRLMPGTELIVTRDRAVDFQHVNPAVSIAIRNVKERKFADGARAFTAEFSIPSACLALDPLRKLLVSDKPDDLRTVRSILKNATILSEITAGGAPYEVTK